MCKEKSKEHTKKRRNWVSERETHRERNAEEKFQTRDKTEKRDFFLRSLEMMLVFSACYFALRTNNVRTELRSRMTLVFKCAKHSHSHTLHCTFWCLSTHIYRHTRTSCKKMKMCYQCEKGNKREEEGGIMIIYTRLPVFDEIGPIRHQSFLNVTWPNTSVDV